MEDFVTKKRTKKWTLEKVEEIMLAVSQTERIKFHMIPAYEWGYNYLGSDLEKREIYIPPFLATGETVEVEVKDNHGKAKIVTAMKCHNPLECMFMSFFHEVAHIKYPPNRQCLPWNFMSEYHYHCMVTMMAIEIANRYGVEFSDKTIRWRMGLNDHAFGSDKYDGLCAVANKIKASSYVVEYPDKDVEERVILIERRGTKGV